MLVLSPFVRVGLAGSCSVRGEIRKFSQMKLDKAFPMKFSHILAILIDLNLKFLVKLF